MSVKIQRLMGELKKLRKNPSPQSEEKERELAFKIAKIIPKKILSQSLEHPTEIKGLINPQDVNKHPLLL